MLAWLTGIPADRASRAQVGRAGERAAARMLRRKGHRILAQNLDSVAGEADIVALDRDTGSFVVVEVKSRILRPGSRLPETGLGTKQRKRLVALTGYLARTMGYADAPHRIDFIAVSFASGQKPLGRNAKHDPQIRHHPAAVGAS
ncbi:MAG: YraN family protein [Planctomycetota bacterium]